MIDKAIIDKYIADNYASEAGKLTKDNIDYSTKLAAMIKMIESYLNVYIQLRKETVKFQAKVITENANGDKKYIAEIQRMTRNQLNKIDNLDSQFQRLIKIGNKEFDRMLGNEDFGEALLDLFDIFWNKNVIVENRMVYINENPEVL